MDKNIEAKINDINFVRSFIALLVGTYLGYELYFFIISNPSESSFSLNIGLLFVCLIVSLIAPMRYTILLSFVPSIFLNLTFFVFNKNASNIKNSSHWSDLISTELFLTLSVSLPVYILRYLSNLVRHKKEIEKESIRKKKVLFVEKEN